MSIELFARVITATGEIVAFATEPLPFEAGQSSVSLGLWSTTPDPRLKRYDGVGGVRDATAQEISDFDNAQRDSEARREIEEGKALKALVLWIAGRLGVAPATARDEIIAIYKGL